MDKKDLIDKYKGWLEQVENNTFPYKFDDNFYSIYGGRGAVAAISQFRSDLELFLKDLEKLL